MEKTIRIAPPEILEDVEDEIKAKLDEFLDVYSFYLKTRICWIRDEVRMKAYELSLLNRDFTFRG